MKFTPASSYDDLKRQAHALNQLAIAQEQELSLLRNKDHSHSEAKLQMLEAALESERAMNAQLTEELQQLEQSVLTFTLMDETQEKDKDIKGHMENKAGLGICLHFEGYSDSCSNDDNGTPVYIEKYNGELRVIVYADINQEDPTHIISLEGAKNSARHKD